MLSEIFMLRVEAILRASNAHQRHSLRPHQATGEPD
jgi:hypothetical protein